MPSRYVQISGVMTWADDAQPAHPIAPGGPPLGTWGGVAPPYPSHPIAPGGRPPGFWGGEAPPSPSHPIAPGGPPPSVWPDPGHPSHPIAGTGERPDHELPGAQPPASGWQYVYSPEYGWHWALVPSGERPSHPIAPGGSPGYPSHPIAPGGERPTHPIAPGGPPPTVWPGPGAPSHPIAPGGGPSQGGERPDHELPTPPTGVTKPTPPEGVTKPTPPPTATPR